MTDEQKSNKEQFQNWCETMDFVGMREAMMSQKEELCGCGCLEMMKKTTMEKSSWPQTQEKETAE
jgi:hypothetical protein